ncbi:CDP-alcohol phosphatidyltransferase family protein [Mesorhizobium sp. CAU 1741]|uniref:CDP-alcohol phosphatidyltransferase family protein n=1 Tax=Mesorhizobium sp. CAU 1741 TaxID=3140366 RepID=UPI00325A5A39
MSVTSVGSTHHQHQGLRPDGRHGGAGRQLVLAALLLAVPVWALASHLSPEGTGALALLAVFIFALTAVAAALGLRTGYPHGAIGACNLITLLRAALASVLVVPLALAAGQTIEAATWWTLLAIALVAFALDAVDGWLARRNGMSSAFGARFDMEVDALLALLLASLAFLSGKAGSWVLVLGLMRYAFVAASAVVPWLAAPLPESMRRKTVCVVQIGVLVALLVPFVVPPLSGILAGAAAALLTWSFAVDILWLYRQPR